MEEPARASNSRSLKVAAALRNTRLDALDARLLLQHVLGLDHAALIRHRERVLAAAELSRFEALVERRSRGEPIAYLIGWREFYGRRFEVDSSVLIPRPETELLVDLALDRIAPGGVAAILDVATGSGNVAITIALERSAAKVVGTDASPGALGCAWANALRLGANRVELLHGDWFAPVQGRQFDLIVSNPPYVAEADPHLGLGDVRFEPRFALAAGADGLGAIRVIVGQARHYLTSRGWLLLEHGYDQEEACAALLEQAGLTDRFVAKDLAGMPRVSGGRA